MMNPVEVHINRDFVDVNNKLAIVQFAAMRSQFDNDPSSIQLFIKKKSLRLKLEIDSGHNIYTSTKNNIDDSQLFICKRCNNQLICIPLSLVCSMRSDFSHLNPKEEVDPKEEIKPVSVKFATTDRRERPVRYQDSRNELDDVNEDYRQLLLKDSHSSRAASLREAMFGKHIKIKIDPDGPPQDSKFEMNLMPDIKPKIERMDVDEIYTCTSAVHSNQQNSDLVRRLVKECLIKAKIVNYEEVFQYLSMRQNDTKNIDTVDSKINPKSKDILDSLNEYAVLVRGNWAVKSEILYGDSGTRECTDVTGVAINLFTASRDYLLWLFTQNNSVSRAAFSSKVKLPDHDVLELFNQLAVYRRHSKEWELKLPIDQRFIDSFPDIVQRQNTFWKVRKSNKLAVFE